MSWSVGEVVNTHGSHPCIQGFEPPTDYHEYNLDISRFFYFIKMLFSFYHFSCIISKQIKKYKVKLCTYINYWLGYLDSNQGNNRFRVCRLTAWLYPNGLRFYQALNKYTISVNTRQAIFIFSYKFLFFSLQISFSEHSEQFGFFAVQKYLPKKMNL